MTEHCQQLVILYLFYTRQKSIFVGNFFKMSYWNKVTFNVFDLTDAANTLTYW